jgi:hypothetical protein
MTGILQILFASYAAADTTITADFLVIAGGGGGGVRLQLTERLTQVEVGVVKMGLAMVRQAALVLSSSKSQIRIAQSFHRV